MGRPDISDQYRNIIIRHKHMGYDLNVMRQSACLVINRITVSDFAALFNCTPVNRASDGSPFVCCLVYRGYTDDLLLLQIPGCVVWQTGDLHLSRKTLCLLSPCLCLFIVLKRDFLFTVMNH